MEYLRVKKKNRPTHGLSRCKVMKLKCDNVAPSSKRDQNDSPSSKRSSANKDNSSSTSSSSGDVYLGFGKIGSFNDDASHYAHHITHTGDETLNSDCPYPSDSHIDDDCVDDDSNEDCGTIVQSGITKKAKRGRMVPPIEGRPRYMRSILCKQPRPALNDGRLEAIRPRVKAKKFSCAMPSMATALDLHLLPSKPRSPRKCARVRPPAMHDQIRIEPGKSMNPSQSMGISPFTQRQQCQQHSLLTDEDNGEDAEDHMDTTQIRIKEFLDKACADAVRSRTKIGPTISLSDLASIDEQKTSMPILVEGILGPEERKRQVSKVYPMRTPSPLHNPASRLQGSHQGSRSTSRASRGDPHGRRAHSPLILPPIILPPIRENREFKPHHTSLSSVGEGSVGVSKPVTEEDWRSLRRCRYLRIPDAPNDVTFDVMANIDTIFK